MDTEPIETSIIPQESSQALQIRQKSEIGLFGTQDPAAVIGKAKLVAQALKDVIVKQGLVSKIQGKEYARCEAWTLLGTMLGVFPVLVWSRPVEGGWEARVEARTKDGAIIGAAEAQCLRSERNWKDREEFALRSMAQTRATAKCLRMPLGFVMSLTGFEVTPAEEMVSDHPRKPEPKPERAATKVATIPPCATETQKAKLLNLLQPVRDVAQDFFRKIDWLLPTESLEHLDLKYVPSVQRQMKDLEECLAEFGNGDQARKPYEPNWTDKPPAPKVELPKSNCLQGKIAHVTLKHGTNKKGNPWTLYGIKVGEEWVNTFDTKIGQLAQDHLQEEASIYFEDDGKGKKALEIVLPDGTRHKSED